MIVFTRLNRTEIGLNPDQIQRVESTPDTVITLDDDKRVPVLVANTIDMSVATRPALHLVSGGTDPARHEVR